MNIINSENQYFAALVFIFNAVLFGNIGDYLFQYGAVKSFRYHFMIEFIHFNMHFIFKTGCIFNFICIRIE